MRDDALAQRIAQWRAVPDRLNGTPATSAALATRDRASPSTDADGPAASRSKRRRWSTQCTTSREMGQRSVTNRKDIEAQFKREQRTFSHRRTPFRTDVR